MNKKFIVKASVAQMAVHSAVNRRVLGSSPSRSDFFFFLFFFILFIFLLFNNEIIIKRKRNIKEKIKTTTTTRTMLSQSPTPSPTIGTSPLPPAGGGGGGGGGRNPRPGTKKPGSGERDQQRERRKKRDKDGRFAKGIPNKYLVFPDKEETDKSNKVIITQRKRDIVRNTMSTSKPNFIYTSSMFLNRYFENSRH